MTWSDNFEDQAGLSFLSVRHVILNQLFRAVIDPGAGPMGIPLASVLQNDSL